MNRNSSQLARHITLVSLIFYGVGDILGAGIYGLIGKTAGIVGNGVWLAFLMSALAAVFTGLTYSSLGSRYPRAAGTAYVLKKTFNSPFLAYVFSVAALCSGLVSMSAASRAFSGYLIGLLPSLNLEFGILLFVLLLTLIVAKGIKESMWANYICTIIELSGLIFIILIGISFLGQASLLDFSSPQNSSSSPKLSLVFSGSILAFYSFMGFEDILNVAEEVKEPQKNLPLGIIASIAISSAIYMLISIVSVSVVPANELAASSQPLVEVVRRAAPWFPAEAFSIISMFAIANTALLNFIMASRLIYGMSREGLLPKSWGYVSPKTQTPIFGIFICIGVVLIMAYTSEITILAKSSSLLVLSGFVMMNLSLVLLKKNKPEQRGDFEIPYIVPALGFTLAFTLIASASWQEIKIALIFYTVATVLYFFVKPKPAAIEKMG